MNHGITRYCYGCRCQTCRDAKAALQRGYRKHRYLNRGSTTAPITGTRRRLQALAAIGWNSDALAEITGIHPKQIQEYTSANTRRAFVYLSTARTVADAYNKLSMTHGPSHITAGRAKAKGWAPPLAWDDDDLDNPNAKPKYGRRPKGFASNLPDLDILVAEVNRAGMHVVAEKYGVSPSSIGVYLNKRGYYASHTGNKYELPVYRRKAA